MPSCSVTTYRDLVRAPFPSLVVLAALTVLVAGGCTSEQAAQAPPTSTSAVPEPSPSSSGSSSASADPTAAAAALVFDQPEGGSACFETAEPRSLAWFDSGVAAQASGRVVRVETPGAVDVRLVERDSLWIPPATPGTPVAFTGSVDWPLTRPMLSDQLAWDRRGLLADERFAKGDAGLPVLHLVGEVGGSLPELVYVVQSGGDEQRIGRAINLTFEPRC